MNDFTKPIGGSNMFTLISKSALMEADLLDSGPSAWVGHIPFAFWIIEQVQPRILVELGTHYGHSYFSFCQGVRANELSTKCYAVDTWQGDEHAGFYGEEVFAHVEARNQRQYYAFSRLLRMRFDDALSYFSDGTIDLLHIDGLHTYEAVQHDFEAWLPKLSSRGVVLFHDINVRERGFGVWRLWEELSTRYPHIEFEHSHGLGVLFVGDTQPSGITELLKEWSTPEGSSLVKYFFAKLGHLAGLEYQAQGHNQAIAEREAQIISLNQGIVERDGQISSLNQTVTERDAQIKNLNQKVSEQDTIISEKEGRIESLEEIVREKESQITNLSQTVTERNTQISSLNQAVAEREAQIASLNQGIAERDGQIAALYNSRSWQFTKPLRLIGTKFRQMIARVDIIKTIGGFTRANGLRAGYRLFKGRRLLLRSGTFDTNYYLSQNPDVAAARIDPALHFMIHGVREGRDPNAFFDTNWYLRQNPDVAEAGLNPLVHYIQFGADEGRDPSSRFSGSAYLAANPDVAAAGMNPLAKRVQTISGESEEEISYAVWIAENEPGEDELERQRDVAKTLSYRPFISIITPTYNTPPKILKEAIESVLAQTYDRWELCLVDGSSTNPEVQSILEEYTCKDKRIHVKFLDENLGISGNSNEALSLAKGEFIALLDHDDLLAPFALFEVVKRLNEDTKLDFIYSDKDNLTEDGKQRFHPLFKPDWSPEIMLSANYLTHLCVIRKRLIDEIGGFLPETDGAQDWDLFLRIIEQTKKIAHIPKVLYHWRESPTSVARGIEAKPYALAAQLIAIQRHLHRRGLASKVSFEFSGYIRVKWLVTGSTKVSIIITTKDNLQILRRCIDSLLQKTSYENFEVVVVDSGSSDPEVSKYYEELSKDSRIQIINYDAPFNYSAVNNLGVRFAKGDVFLFLNNDTEILNSDWLEEMVGWIEQKEIGVVGAKLLKPDGTIQHAGVIIGLQGFVGHIFAEAPEGYWGVPFGGSEWYRDYLAVSGACMMVRREVFERVGRFNEAFSLCGSDVELCLRVREEGYRVVYTPYARLTHLDTAMRGEAIPQQDFQLSYQYYEPFLRKGDPYYNENISPWHPIPRLKRRGEKSPLEFARRFLGTELAKAPTSPNYRLNEETAPPPSLWGRYSLDASVLAECFDFTVSDLEASHNVVLSHKGHLDIKSINWFVPDFDHAFYGGIHTILRFAAYFKERKEVQSRFVVTGAGPNQKIAAAIGKAFPNLSGERIVMIQSEEHLRTLEDADASVATLWNTAYFVLKFNRTARKFYFVQDFEPLFYPAGSTNAQAEATYRFGFYGITNTMTLKEIYEREYGGRAEFFAPAVDTQIFHPSPEPKMKNDKCPFTVFFYGRPEHPRNGFELGIAALRRLKSRLGKKVRILNAGAPWPCDFGLNGIVENLGLLQYEETAALYRTCDVGLVMMFTRHPSYLPFELMASGCLVVSNYNPATTWLLQDRVNCLLSDPSASCLADTMERALTDTKLRARITAEALAMIQARYSNWEEQIEKTWSFMSDPSNSSTQAPPPRFRAALRGSEGDAYKIHK